MSHPIGDAFKTMCDITMIALWVMFPLALWKVIDIIIWLIHHLRVVIK
jgi:hypothetical protein